MTPVLTPVAAHRISGIARPAAAADRLLARLRPRSVALFRALQLGDMLCAVPALRALRIALPQARITLVGLAWARSYARRYAHYIDDFIAFPGYPGLPEQAADAKALAHFLHDMRERQFDLAIQMHGDGRLTNSLVGQFGARRSAGFCSSDVVGAEVLGNYLPYPEGITEVQRLLRLMEFLGAPSSGEHLEFPLAAEDDAELARHGLARRLPAGAYACLHPGARAVERRWPVRCFAALGDALREEFGLDIVITGSEHESALAAELAGAMRGPSVDAAAAISYGALAALMRGARILVTNDTGVSHLAAALRLPSVVVFRASDMERWAPLDRRLHRCVWDPAGAKAAEVLRHARELLAAAGVA